MNFKVIQKEMQKQEIDCIFLMNLQHKDPNIYYVSHINAEYTFIFLEKNKKPLLYASSLEFEKIKQESLVKNVELLNKNPFELLNNIIKQNNYERVGVNKSVLTINEFKAIKKQVKGKKVKWIDVSKLFTGIRTEKTEEEVKIIQTACEVGDAIFKEVVQNFKKFKTELDVAKFIEKRAKDYNCTLSFPVIIGSGKNGAIPHYEPKNLKLNNGFCVMDFGVRYKGYCSDMTRTIYIGEPTKQEVEHYNLVLDAIYECRKLIKHNVKVSMIDDYVRKKFGKLNKFYVHALGHGLGTEVHELPALSSKSKERLKNNTVFTIEPGLYFPGRYGIRIEDDYVLRDDKIIQLTKSEHTLIKIT